MESLSAAWETEFIYSAIAASADDHAARWLLARHFAERGDVRADGYLYMATMARRPDCWTGQPQGIWRGFSTFPSSLPSPLAAKLADFYMEGDLQVYSTRRAAEEALCRAVMQQEHGSSSEHSIGEAQTEDQLNQPEAHG